jgi:hypothetical protein
MNRGGNTTAGLKLEKGDVRREVPSENHLVTISNPHYIFML